MRVSVPMAGRVEKEREEVESVRVRVFLWLAGWRRRGRRWRG